MKTFSCPKCGSIDLFLKQNGNNTGLYCGDCGAWIKWVDKNEKMLVERFIETTQPKDISKDNTHFDIDGFKKNIMMLRNEYIKMGSMGQVEALTEILDTMYKYYVFED